MKLLERADESRTLERALTDAEGGEGRVVLISGEAGIGKTSLVARFLASAGDRARSLSGTCDDLLTPRTLGPVRDIAHAADETLGAAVLEGTGERLYRALLDLLTSTSVPTILVIEDLHWATMRRSMSPASWRPASSPCRWSASSPIETRRWPRIAR